MAKKKRAPAFGNEESESDNDEPYNFRAYINERSVKIQKTVKDQSEASAKKYAEYVSVKQMEAVRQDSKSSYIDGLLGSKKQRDSDKLFIHAMKNQLRSNSELSDGRPVESFVTKEYESQKKEYELVTKLAEEEANEQENDGSYSLLGGSAQSVALNILLTDDKPRRLNSRNTNETKEEETKYSKKESGMISLRVENDIYIAAGCNKQVSGSATTSNGSLSTDLDSKSKENFIKEYLQTHKTSEELKARLKDYHRRQKND